MKTLIIKGYKFYSFKDILKQKMKSREFRIGYDKEVARLNMIHQLKLARAAKRMTQKKLAEKVSMPQSAIARIESGRKGISLSTLNRIASVLGKRVELV